MSATTVLASVLLPATDRAVYTQAVVAAMVFAAVAWLVRRNRDLLMFVGGLATVTAAAMALRTVH